MGPVALLPLWHRVGVAALVGSLGTACFDGDLEAFAEVPETSEGAEGGASTGTTVSGTSVGTGGASDGGSGTGGERSTTGSGGSGATSPSELLVDDFEDEDTLASNGFGWWYTQNDGAGDQSLSISAVSDRPGSSFAAHTSGVGFDNWGAFVGLDFTPGDGSYDGSAFRRLRFWAKASPDSVTTVSVRLLESDWHFGTDIDLSTTWSEYVLVFDELPGAEEGSPDRLDPSRLYAFQVFVLSEERFELWIDDVVLDTL